MAEQNQGGVILLFILALATHGLDVYVRLRLGNPPILHPIGIFYIALIVLAGILLDKNKILTYFGVSLIAYFIPFVNYFTIWTNKLGGFGSFVELFIATFLLFAPVWILYLMYVMNKSETPRSIQKLGVVYLLIWMVIFLPAAYQEIMPKVADTTINVPGILPGYTIAQIVNFAATGVTKTLVGIAAVRPWTTQQIQAQVEYAQTGVDPRRKANMEKINKRNPGVMIENLKAAEPVFYTNSPAVVYAKFKADTIDKPFDAELECFATSMPIPASRIMPSDTFHIESYEEQDIDCIFDAETLSKGNHIVHLSTLFDFKTMANLETFVMENERLKIFKSEQKDPLAGYPQPRTLTTKGPVNLNIEMPKAPIGIEPDKKITFTINALNEWRGKIMEIHNLIIYLPKGIMLEGITGRPVEQITCDRVPAEERELCDDAKVNIYALAQSELQKPSYKNITAAFGFRAYARVDDYKQVLGETPINAQSFAASLEYNYKIEKTISIKVKEPAI